MFLRALASRKSQNRQEPVTSGAGSRPDAGGVARCDERLTASVPDPFPRARDSAMHRGALEIFRPRQRPWPNARNKSANAPDCTYSSNVRLRYPPARARSQSCAESDRAERARSSPGFRYRRSSGSDRDVRKQNGATLLAGSLPMSCPSRDLFRWTRGGEPHPGDA